MTQIAVSQFMLKADNHYPRYILYQFAPKVKPH